MGTLILIAIVGAAGYYIGKNNKK